MTNNYLFFSNPFLYPTIYSTLYVYHKITMGNNFFDADGHATNYTVIIFGIMIFIIMMVTAFNSVWTYVMRYVIRKDGYAVAPSIYTSGAGLRIASQRSDREGFLGMGGNAPPTFWNYGNSAMTDSTLKGGLASAMAGQTVQYGTMENPQAGEYGETGVRTMAKEGFKAMTDDKLKRGLYGAHYRL